MLYTGGMASYRERCDQIADQRDSRAATAGSPRRTALS